MPDLILMDIELKHAAINGNVICLRLKAERATFSIPVMLLSAERDLGAICRSCGADAFLFKPFDIANLTQKVRELIGPA